jgi:trigger factor
VKVTNDKTESRQVFLTIEMEPAEVEESLAAAYRELVKKTEVPGFRRGKAPRAVLERHVGRESLFDKAVDIMIPKAFEKALKEQGIESFARPSIEVAQTEPVVFKAVVPLPPLVELGDYHQVQMKPEPVKVSKEDVNAVIERLRHDNATWEPVERAVGFNDLIVLDIESTVGGKPFINRQGIQYRVLADQSMPLPGFAEQLVGMERETEKEFQLQFAEDHPESDLAGKEVHFKVKVGEIKQEKLPKLDNEFAKGIDPKFETVAALRKQITSELTSRAEEKSRFEFEERVIEAVVDLAQVEYPPFLVEAEIDHLFEQQLRRWQESGRGVEEYLAATKKTEEELREELRPPATKRVNWSLVLNKITEEEKIEVADSEIDGEIEKMAQSVAEDKRDTFSSTLNVPRSRQSIKDILLRRKTVQRLVEIAQSAERKTETQEKEASR